MTIETSSATIFRNENSELISADDFFDGLAQGALVKAKGVELAAQVIDAAEVEIEVE